MVLNSDKISVAVIGGRGYSGQELVRILRRHPRAQLTAVLNSQDCIETALNGCPTVFLATPAEVSMTMAPKLLAQGLSVIDLSGAFRLPQGDIVTEYAEWYQMEHLAPDWVKKAHYGLIPWAKPSAAQPLIANPGCYASATLLALLPLLKAGLIRPETIVIDAKSGTTGAGKKADEGLLFSEVQGECLPYKVGRHQHLPELTQWSARLAGVNIDPFFTTHLLPCRRGIVVGIYARLENHKKLSDVVAAYEESYVHYEFVSHGLASEKTLVQLKRVVGTPKTHISYHAVGDKLYVYSIIDNLLKGAASQAIENFNLLHELPVATGLNYLEAMT